MEGLLKSGRCSSVLASGLCLREHTTLCFRVKRKRDV